MPASRDHLAEPWRSAKRGWRLSRSVTASACSCPGSSSRDADRHRGGLCRNGRAADRCRPEQGDTGHRVVIAGMFVDDQYRHHLRRPSRRPRGTARLRCVVTDGLGRYGGGGVVRSDLERARAAASAPAPRAPGAHRTGGTADCPPRRVEAVVAAVSSGLVGSAYWSFAGVVVFTANHDDPRMALVLWTVIGVAGIAGGRWCSRQACGTWEKTRRHHRRALPDGG